MDKKKLETFKKKLETRQQELRRTVVRNEQDGRTADEDSAQDIADRAANSYTKEFLFSQSNNDRQLLQMVDGALRRIREGTFGECVSCGKEINAKRLEAVPWTRHCIECQEKLEKGELEQATALARPLFRTSEPPSQMAVLFWRETSVNGIVGALTLAFLPCYTGQLPIHR